MIYAFSGYTLNTEIRKCFRPQRALKKQGEFNINKKWGGKDKDIRSKMVLKSGHYY